MAPTAGMLVSNNVRLVSPLAEGGMGSVWVAEHLGLSTQVAVKFIAEDIAKHKISVERFKREASAAAQIRSQHVVQVFDHGVTNDGVPYIVMELMEGEDLGKRVERLGPLSVEMTTIVVSQACRALSRAHALGIVHRDIKPDNLFLCESDGELLVKILDFGVAKKTSEFSNGVTTTGVVVGTPSYMSPEQVLSSKDVDGRSDLWSLGVVAYHCLTAQVPFDGETFGALAVAINAGTYAPLTQVCPQLPPVLDQWMALALAKDRDHRFSTAKEMSAALVHSVNPSAAVNADSTGGLRPILESHPDLMGGRGTAVPSTTPSPGQFGHDPNRGIPTGSGPTYTAATSTPEPSAAVPLAPQPTFDGASVENGNGARRRWGIRAAVVAGLALMAGVGAAAVLFAPIGSTGETAPGSQTSGQEAQAAEARSGADDDFAKDPNQGDGAAIDDSAKAVDGADDASPTVSAAGTATPNGGPTPGAPPPDAPSASPAPASPAPASPAPTSPAPGKPTAKPAPPPVTAPPRPPRGAPTPAPFPQMDDRGF